MSMCRVFSCVVGRGCLLWPVHSLGKILLVFALLHSVLQGQICLLLQVFFDSYFCIPVPCNEKDILELFNFSFFSVSGWGIDLDYHDIECFALETNRDHSVIFEIASKYCISDSFVDYDGYSISAKGFLPTVVDILVIWVTIHPFQSILVCWFLEYRCSLLSSPVWPLPVSLDSSQGRGSLVGCRLWGRTESDMTEAT